LVRPAAQQLNGRYVEATSLLPRATAGRMLPVARKNGCTSALDPMPPVTTGRFAAPK